MKKILTLVCAGTPIDWAKTRSVKVVKQIAAEFWIPFAVAVAWTVYVFDARQLSLTIANVLGTFIPSLFMLSWFTGNINRVKSKIRTDEGLTDIHARTKQLLDDLEAKTTNIIGHMTGGDSFCTLFFAMPSSPGPVHCWLSHKGDYSLHDVHLRAIDLDEVDRYLHSGAVTINGFFSLGQRRAVSTLREHVATSIGPLNLPAPTNNKIRMKIEFEARNGTFHQTLLIDTTASPWTRATRVERKKEGKYITIDEQVDEAYPRGADGEVSWS